MKKKKKSRVLLFILLFLLIPVISITGFKLATILLDYKKDEVFNQNIRDIAVIDVTPTDEIDEDSTYTPANTFRPKITNSPHNTQTDETEQPLVIDFGKLKEINKNCFCWLQIPGTNVSYPVVYTDDNSFYLRRGLDGSKLSSGTLFADARNRHFFKDDNFIIYGHHIQSGIMFAPLVKYKSQDFYSDHKYGYVITEEGNYRLDFFAGIITDSKDEVYTTSLQGRELFDKFITDCKIRSTFLSDVVVKYEDRIVTLSTCSYEFENARYVLIGKLVKL